MSKNKYMLYSLLVMLLWGTLFPMVKLGYGAYNIVTSRENVSHFPQLKPYKRAIRESHLR